MRGAETTQVVHIGAALVEAGCTGIPAGAAHEEGVATEGHGRPEGGPALHDGCVHGAREDPVMPMASIQMDGTCGVVPQHRFIGGAHGKYIAIDAQGTPEVRVGIIGGMFDGRHAGPRTVDERPGVHDRRRDAQVIIVPGCSEDPLRRAGDGPAERGRARAGSQCRVDAPRLGPGRSGGPHGQGCPSMRHAHEGEDRERVCEGRDLGAEPRPTMDCVTHGRSPDGRKPGRSSHASGRDPGKPPEVR